MASRRLLPVAYAAVLAAGYLLVFVLPWHLAPGAPASSNSYAVGFSNRTSLLGALATAVALFGLGFIARRRDLRPLVRAEAAPRSERVPRWLVGGLAGVSLASAVFFASVSYGTYSYGEKNYFLDRLAYVLNGNVPFRDMEFTYGPLLAYLPAWAWRLARPFGVPPQAAYAAVYVLLFVAGVPLLAYVVDRLEMTRRQRTMLFAGIGAVAAINETVGINGLLVRFLLPVAAVLFFHAVARAALARDGRGAASRLAAASVAAWATCFLVSLEVGIACFLAIGVYLGWVTAVEKRREALPALGVLLLSPLLAVALLGTGSLTHLAGMASGALNFPVLPSPPVMLVLAALLGGTALLPRFLSLREPASAAMLALGVVAAVMLAGALGRADTSHAYFYGLAVVLFAAPAVAAANRPAFAIAAAVFAVVFLFAHALVLRYDYGGTVVSATAGTRWVSRRTAGRVAFLLGSSRQNGYLAWARGRAERRAYDLDGFAPYRPLAAPLGFVDDAGLRLGERRWLASPYFRGVPFTPRQLATTKRYLDDARHVILESGYARALAQAPVPAPVPRPGARPSGGGAERYMANLMWPETFAPRNAEPDLWGELRAYLAEHYRPVADVGPYTVLERKE